MDDLEELATLSKQRRVERGGQMHVHGCMPRGGHPSLYDEVEYVIDHEHMIIAEFICMLSDPYACSTNDIIFVTDTRVLSL